MNYATQTDTQRKKGGGVGRNKNSFWKHDEIERFMRRQLPVISKQGHGCIIDMHAGDGDVTEHPIPDMFSGGSIKSTPALCIALARKYQAQVVLCESSHATRRDLQERYGDQAEIIGSNSKLLDDHWRIRLRNYRWLLVLNDPNGFGTQSENVMQTIATVNRCSDFIIVVNAASYSRPLGLEAQDLQSLSAKKSAEDHKWMLEKDAWCRFLQKRQAIETKAVLSANMKPTIFLVSNFISGFGR